MGKLSFLRPIALCFEHELHESGELTYFSLKPLKSQKYFSSFFRLRIAWFCRSSVLCAFALGSLWVRFPRRRKEEERHRAPTNNNHPARGGETMVVEGEVVVNVNRSDFFIWDVK